MSTGRKKAEERKKAVVSAVFVSCLKVLRNGAQLTLSFSNESETGQFGDTIRIIIRITFDQLGKSLLNL